MERSINHGNQCRKRKARIAYIKYYGAKVLHDVIDRAIQANGSLGYSGDLPLEFMYIGPPAGVQVLRWSPTRCAIATASQG